MFLCVLEMIKLALITVVYSQVQEFHHKIPGYEVENSYFTSYEQKHDLKLSSTQKLTLIKNREKIRIHNEEYRSGKQSYYLAENRHAHLSFSEFKSKNLMASQDCSATSTSSVLPLPLQLSSIPKFKDWRVEGHFVTPVKNQGHCGSCWTFSSTGCLESAWAVHKGELTSLSEQQLIDCAGDFDNHGCSGGLPSHAFEYVAQNGGIDTEEGYVYEGKEEGSCSYKSDFASPIQIKGSFNITQGDEDALFQAVLFLGLENMKIT